MEKFLKAEGEAHISYSLPLNVLFLFFCLKVVTKSQNNSLILRSQAQGYLEYAAVYPAISAALVMIV